MFGLGATEIVVILVIALIVLGPKNLPEVASVLGSSMRKIQRAAADFTREISYPTDFNPLRNFPQEERQARGQGDLGDPTAHEESDDMHDSDGTLEDARHNPYHGIEQEDVAYHEAIEAESNTLADEPDSVENTSSEVASNADKDPSEESTTKA